MTKKVPTVQVVVHRDGQLVRPEVGKVFDFTADEIKEIESLRKNSLRDPVNEDPAAGKPQNARAARADGSADNDTTIDPTAKPAANVKAKGADGKGDDI